MKETRTSAIDIGSFAWIRQCCRSQVDFLVYLIAFCLPCVSMVFASEADASTRLPFVTCADDNPDHAAISTPAPAINLPTAIAAQLAIYASDATMVLAPRGWTCESDEGPAGIALWVYPRGASINTTGPLIVAREYGEGVSYGNSYVYSYGPTYFPKVIPQKDIDDFLIGSGQSKKEFLAPRYRTDIVKYENKYSLRFITPAGKHGLADSIFERSATLTSYGRVELHYPTDDDPEIFFFGVRLSQSDAHLHSVILDFSEKCF
jgi:hypothetical protein